MVNVLVLVVAALAFINTLESRFIDSENTKLQDDLDLYNNAENRYSRVARAVTEESKSKNTKVNEQQTTDQVKAQEPVLSTSAIQSYKQRKQKERAERLDKYGQTKLEKQRVKAEKAALKASGKVLDKDGNIVDKLTYKQSQKAEKQKLKQDKKAMKNEQKKQKAALRLGNAQSKTAESGAQLKTSTTA